MKALIIFRGLPGAGKTTLARLLAGETWPVFSVDDHFTSADGEYRFDHTENHVAYDRCLRGVEEAMKKDVARIFVHNTFTMEWEMEPYFAAAQTHGYTVFVSTVENRHGGRNVHGISDDQLSKMAEKFRVTL